MRFKTLLAALLAAAIAVSAAIAAPPPGRGKSKGTTETAATASVEDGRGKGKAKGKENRPACKPTVTFLLKGELVSESVAAASGEGSFAMLVEHANRHGRSYVGKQVTIETGRATKMKRRGPASLEQLEAGDRLVVQVRGCKVRSGEGATASAETRLYALRVVGHPKRDAEDGGEDDSASTSTETSTTESTSTETATTAP